MGGGLAFSGAVLFPPRTILAAANSGADRAIGTVLLIVSPLTAAFGPAYGYWKVRRSGAWFILGYAGEHVFEGGLVGVIDAARL